MTRMKHNLKKRIWTQADFRVMGWHDCPIYAVQFADDILLDIDYILEWVVDEKAKCYRFWVAPAAIQFSSPRNLQISVQADFVNGLEIADIKQTRVGTGMYDYQIQTQEGDIRFTAKGFKQHIRKTPVLVKSQCLTDAQRGGYPLRISESSKKTSNATTSRTPAKGVITPSLPARRRSR